MFISDLAAPNTINTMPDETLEAIHDHGVVDGLASDGGNAEAMFATFDAAGVDVEALAAKLQSDGASAFVDSWQDLMDHIAAQQRAVA